MVKHVEQMVVMAVAAMVVIAVAAVASAAFVARPTEQNVTGTPGQSATSPDSHGRCVA